MYDMIRTGAHNAADKWEILCRYWQDPASVSEPIVDKWNRPALPEWQDLALAGGRYACSAFIEQLLHSPNPTNDREDGDDSVTREVRDLAERFGYEELRELVRQLGPTIAASGFGAPFDDRLSPRLT